MKKITFPRNSRVVYTDYQHWLQGGTWATSLAEPLFHFRGSLTSTLNLITILKPGRKIFLVGVDFNSSEYFFQEELDALNFETSDWTTELVKKEKVHFSIQNFEGTNMLDRFPEIIKQLETSENKIYSLNKSSVLVTAGFVEYRNFMFEE